MGITPYLYKQFPPDLYIEMDKNRVLIECNTNFDDYDIVFLRKDLPKFIAQLKEMSRQIDEELRDAGAGGGLTGRRSV